jgi:hypothetical protein
VTLPFGLWMRSGLPETLHIGETGTVIAQTAGSSLGTIHMTTYAPNTLHVATRSPPLLSATAWASSPRFAAVGSPTAPDLGR